MVAADEHLLAVKDVFIAIPDCCGFGVGQVRARLRFGEQLPGPYLTFKNWGEKVLLLLLGSPDHDGIATQSAAGVVVRGQAETTAIDFFFQDDRVIDAQSPAAILLRSGGPQPTLGSQLSPQVPAQLVLIVAKIDGVRSVFDIGRQVAS